MVRGSGKQEKVFQTPWRPLCPAALDMAADTGKKRRGGPHSQPGPSRHLAQGPLCSTGRQVFTEREIGPRTGPKSVSMLHRKWGGRRRPGARLAPELAPDTPDHESHQENAGAAQPRLRHQFISPACHHCRPVQRQCRSARPDNKALAHRHGLAPGVQSCPRTPASCPVPLCRCRQAGEARS